MDLVKLTENIVLSIVSNKDLVAVKEFVTDDYDSVLIQVLVSKDDMQNVIGKNGKVINAIRSLVQASSYEKGNKLVRINVDSI